MCCGCVNVNMKLLLISVLVAFAAADVSHLPKSEINAQILRQNLDVGVEGSYQWAYETDNGISASEAGTLNRAGTDEAAEAVQGQFEWVAPGGEQISVQYEADENGYRPQGAHLPTPPPIPDAIVKLLQYIRDHPPKEELRV